MSAYRRKPTRPPRQIELTVAAIERDGLQVELDKLRRQTRGVLSRNMELESIVRIRDLEVTKLLDDKIRLARELQASQRHLAFLRGEGNPDFYVTRRFYG